MRIYYAQNREDLLIKSFFPDIEKGFYIDVGANDPVNHSVTKLLYDEGWSGINIEPIPQLFRKLEKQRKRDKNLNVGLSSARGELKFREYTKGSGLSTFDTSMAHMYENSIGSSSAIKSHKDYKVPVMTLDEVIAENVTGHINFIKIDVEGYEYEVIRGYEWKKNRPELVCVESNHIHKKKDWKPLLKQHGYQEVFFDGINSYFLAKESMHRKDFFKYPEAVIAGNPISYLAYIEAEDRIKQLEQQKLDTLSARLHDQELEVAFLHRQQRDVRFLAKQLAKEVQVRINKKASATTGSSNHLYYRKSRALNDLLEKQPKDKRELMRATHTVDVESIAHRRLSIKSRIQKPAWRAAALLMNAGSKLARRLARHAN